MTNQLQGEILFGGWEGAGDGGWAHTPWMPVRGDFASFAVEVVRINGVTLTWEVQARTVEDPTVTTIVSAQTLTTVTTGSALNSSAAKQLVRYRFHAGSTVSLTNFAMFRALQPSWQTCDVSRAA
jgi:hypothetical protein